MRKTILSILLLSSAMTGISQTITTFAGTTSGLSGDGGAATAAKLNSPSDVAFDASGNLFIADLGNYRVRKVTSGTISTFAGSTVGYSGDGYAATLAKFEAPVGLVTSSSDVYVADQGSGDGTTGYTVRKINGSGTISTYAGTGPYGFSGDGGAATAAKLFYSHSLTTDASGNILIADRNNVRIRKVDASTGVISTIAGMPGGSYADGISATAAAFHALDYITTDATGNIYLADGNGHTVRKITASTGIINTVAGNGGTTGGPGDGAAATAATLAKPAGIAVDANNNLYISTAYSGQNRVRIVNAISGYIYTYAGTGTAGSSGDGGAATAANLQTPGGLALDVSGNLYIADLNNHKIRKVSNAAPVPTSASRSITVCQNSTNNPITASLLEASDVLGQTTTWTCPSTTVNIPTPSYEATGTGVSPSGVTYTPAAGFSGTDGFTVTVSDGYLTNTITFTVTVTALPSAGTITPGSDYVCQGTTGATAWTSSVGGGTWSSSNNSLASIDATSGVLGGRYGPSTATISYTVTNSCGTGTSTATAHVRGLPTTTGSSNVCEGETTTIYGIPGASGSGISHNSYTYNSSYFNTPSLPNAYDGVFQALTTPGTGVATYTYWYEGDATDYCAETAAVRTFNVIALPSFTITGTSSLSTGGMCGSTTGSLTITGLSSGDYSRAWSSSDASTISVTGTGSPISGANIAYVTSGTGAYADLTFSTMGSYCLNPTTATYRVTICGAKQGEDESSSNAIQEIQKLKISPNPNNGLFTLELLEAIPNTSITIMDISGKTLFTKTTNNSKVDFDFTGYSKGIYILNVESGSKKYHEKISID